MYLLTNSLLGNKMKIANIVIISFIYGVCCYFIKNILTDALGTVVTFVLYSSLYYISSKNSLANCFIVMSLTYGIKFVSEFGIIMYLSSKGLAIGTILDNQVLKIFFCYLTLIIPLILLKINATKKVNILNVFLKRKILISKNKFIVFSLTTLGAINIMTMIGLVVVANMNSYKIYNKYEMVLLIMITCSVLCVTCLIIIVLKLEKNKYIAQKEKNLMINNLKQMEETVDLLRTQKHDYMNHLQIILMQVSNNKNEDARRYILGLAEDVKNIGIVFDTGNNYIDAILNFKNRKCMDLHIQLTACIDSVLEDTQFDDTQLSSVFLNIIDNAIDELKKCKKEYRYIHVDTYKENNKHIISIKNNGSKIEDVEKIFEMGISSNGSGRGYGLYSIKQLMIKNKSSIYVISDEEETEFIIEIPILNVNYDLIINTDM